MKDDRPMTTMTVENSPDPIGKAALLLAKTREAALPDGKGREAAGKKLFEQLLAACEKAGLHVEVDRGYHRIALYHPPAISVYLSQSGGDILLGQSPNVQRLSGWDYDPFSKEYVTAPDKPTAVEVLAQQVGEALAKKAKEKK